MSTIGRTLGGCRLGLVLLLLLFALVFGARGWLDGFIVEIQDACKVAIDCCRWTKNGSRVTNGNFKRKNEVERSNMLLQEFRCHIKAFCRECLVYFFLTTLFCSSTLIDNNVKIGFVMGALGFFFFFSTDFFSTLLVVLLSR